MYNVPETRRCHFLQQYTWCVVLLGVRVVSALVMAGQAAKKAQKQEKAAASTWGPIIAVVNLIYVVLMFVKGAWSRRLVTAFVFTSLLYWCATIS